MSGCCAAVSGARSRWFDTFPALVPVTSYKQVSAAMYGEEVASQEAGTHEFEAWAFGPPKSGRSERQKR